MEELEAQKQEAEKQIGNIQKECDDVRLTPIASCMPVSDEVTFMNRCIGLVSVEQARFMQWVDVDL